MGSPQWLSGKESISNSGVAEDVGSIPGLRRSPGVGNGNPLQYSCLKNRMVRVAWQATYSPKCCKESDTTEYIPKKSNDHIFKIYSL